MDAFTKNNLLGLLQLIFNAQSIVSTPSEVTLHARQDSRCYRLLLITEQDIYDRSKYKNAGVTKLLTLQKHEHVTKCFC
jgi:hypothetical protein